MHNGVPPMPSGAQSTFATLVCKCVDYMHLKCHLQAVRQKRKEKE